MTDPCLYCGEPTTAEFCRNGDPALAHLVAWESLLIKRRKDVELTVLRRRLRGHTPIWERDLEETA